MTSPMRGTSLLLRLNLLKFGYAFEPEWRAVRDLARKRQQLVQLLRREAANPLHCEHFFKEIVRYTCGFSYIFPVPAQSDECDTLRSVHN